MGQQHLSDLSAIIDDLDAMGRLARVWSEVDLKHDLAGIAAELEGGPRAVLFGNVNKVITTPYSSGFTGRGNCWAI